MISNVQTSFGRIGHFLWQMIGHFGWTAFYPQRIVPILFLVALLGLVAIGRYFGKRQIVLVWSLFLFVIFAPGILEGVNAASQGFFYQGRYMIPIAVGAPLLLVAVGHDRFKKRRESLLGLTFIACCVVSNIFVTWQTARRFVVGMNGPIWWPKHPQWLPLGGTLSILFPLAVATASAVVMGAVMFTYKWTNLHTKEQ
jgi:hypothetical protein